MKSEEIKKIIDNVGEKIIWSVDRYFPFIHKEIWVFGGHCGLCGKWNWQWRMKCSILGVTYACEECQKK